MFLNRVADGETAQLHEQEQRNGKALYMMS